MRLGLLSAIVVASGINLGCTNPLENQKEITMSSIEEILKQRELLQKMTGKGVCQIVEHEEKATNGKVIVEGYKCEYDTELQKIPSVYGITVSKYDKKYYGPRLEICRNIEINYGKIDKSSPIIKGKRVIVEKVGGEEEIIDDVDCKTLYNIIEI